MKLYLDLIFFLNFIFDFLLLVTVKIVRKEKTNLKRLILSSLLGGLTIFFLFLNLNSFTLFLLKVIMSILMIKIAFKKSNKKTFIQNIITLYIVSFFLGGSLYFLNIEFSYKQEGILFYHNGFSINIIVLLILTPILLWFYKEEKKKEQYYKELYYLTITLKDKTIIHLNAFLDTGCRLKDPYLNRPIIITNKLNLKDNYILVPFSTITERSYLKCYEVEEVEIEGRKLKNILLGISPTPINMDKVDCIIGTNLWEE